MLLTIDKKQVWIMLRTFVISGYAGYLFTSSKEKVNLFSSLTKEKSKLKISYFRKRCLLAVQSTVQAKQYPHLAEVA
jgi:hypothetical protein